MRLRAASRTWELSMSIGIWQVVLVLLIVLILFGAGKLPKVMGDVAKGVKNFKAGMKDDEDEDKKVLTSDATPAAGEASMADLKRDEAAKS
jgi:sec-independent protein translocase protein TatA